MAEVLRLNTKLLVLFIRWNSIKAKGASYLAKVLSSNENLQILDASFNSFGTQAVNMPVNNTLSMVKVDATQAELLEETKMVNKMLNFSKVNIGQEMQNMFKENKVLIHVDLSHNNLKSADCELIEEGLKDNHTILGLHMIGNDYNTNSLGYFARVGSDPS